MSGGRSCKCPESKVKITERKAWIVTTYKGNSSAFNGYRFQHSDYSALHCVSCHASWRTRGKYVDKLPNESYRSMNEATGSDHVDVRMPEDV